jgi:hypothetical protein
MRYAGSNLGVNVGAIPPMSADRFAGSVAKSDPELVDRIKLVISTDLPETGQFDESNY